MKIKKRYILLILVVLVLFSDTTAMLFNRIAFSSSERVHLKELKSLSAEEILSDMSDCSHLSNDYYDLHLYALRNKRKEKPSGFWYEASLNDEYSMPSRRAALQMYADNVGLSLESRWLLFDTPSEKIAEFFKTVLYLVVTSAKMEMEFDLIEDLSSTDEGAGYLEAFFYVSDGEGYNDHILKWFRHSNLYRRYEISEKVLSDHERHSPEQISAALKVRQLQLKNNETEYPENKLFTEREAFTDLCIEIIESELYPVDDPDSVDGTNPAYQAARSLREIYCEKAVRYLFLNEEMILEMFGEDHGFYILFGAVSNNDEMFVKLSKISQKQEDVDLLVKSLKYLPQKDVNDNLQKTLNLDEYKGKYEIEYPDDHDGRFAYTEFKRDVIYSWTFD